MKNIICIKFQFKIKNLLMVTLKKKMNNKVNNNNKIIKMYNYLFLIKRNQKL